MTVVMQGHFGPAVEHEKVSGAGVPARHSVGQWCAVRTLRKTFPNRRRGTGQCPERLGTAPGPVRRVWALPGLTE
jgi:hypothetical protein